MGRQRTGDDRSLLENEATSRDASDDAAGSGAGRSSETDDTTVTDGGTSRGRNGIWDADSYGGEHSDTAPAAKRSSIVPDRSESAGQQSAGDGSTETQSADARSEEDAESEDGLVRVDLDKLTDRQREVLETAHDLGYYQYPRGANASEVADALDICPSTLAEHLAAAQTKLLGDALGEASD